MRGLPTWLGRLRARLASALPVKSAPPAPPADATTQRTRPRRRGIALAAICLLVVLSSLGAGVGYAAYQHYSALYQADRTLASDGVRHVLAAGSLLKGLEQHPFDSARVAQASGEFQRAQQDFSRIQTDLAQVPSQAQALPHYGALLASAQRVLPLALTATSAGLVACDGLSVLITQLGNPLSSSAAGLTTQDVTTLTGDLDTLQTLLETATGEMRQIQPGDTQLDARLGPALATARAALPTARNALEQARELLKVAPQLLGTNGPVNYLVEVLDATEIRPGGGFIGNYGTVTLAKGRLTDIHITDTYLLDTAYQQHGHSIAFPPAYRWFPLAPSWSLRDSNLDADFPTAARYGEQIYRQEGGGTPVQGVIALTPYLIEHALEITGPIYVSEYKETVTAANLIDRIHYHQEGPGAAPENVPSPDGHSSLRKRFTELLFEHFMARVREVATTKAPEFAQLLVSAVRDKDIQLYFNDADAEALLAHDQLASTIAAPASGDSLYVVDANIIANKANNYMTYTMRDQVAISATGTATHTTTLTYAWPDTPASEHNNLYGSVSIYHSYRDYLRVYVPPGGTLVAQSGWQPAGTSTAFGRAVWAGTFSLPFGGTHTITLTWSVPSAAVKDSAGWHYRYLVQRQAGIAWDDHLQITLPTCATVTGTPTGLTATAHSGSANQQIVADTAFALEYVCR